MAGEMVNLANPLGGVTKAILIIRSANDDRMPLDQGLGPSTAPRRKGIPSQFLTFTEENH